MTNKAYSTNGCPGQMKTTAEIARKAARPIKAQNLTALCAATVWLSSIAIDRIGASGYHHLGSPSLWRSVGKPRFGLGWLHEKGRV